MPLNKTIIRRYTNDVFVETGTWWGEGVWNAFGAGFKDIHSIENNKSIYKKALKTFRDYDNVHLYFGDSAEILPDVIGGIDKRMTFWLDAHSPHESPILKELDVISKHPVRTHTIIIDDVEDFEQYGTSIEEVTKILKAINESYQIETYKTKRTVLIASNHN